jgi:restriction system protein
VVTGVAVPIPDFQTIMKPLLQVASDGKQHSNREAREVLASTFKLSDEDKNALLPSGRQGVFVNRVAWAKAYLQQAGLLETPQRGHFRITERITISFLQRFPEFAEFRSPARKPKATQIEANIEEEARTPEETLEAAHLRLRTELAAELLSRVKASSPRFFEQLVVELLLKMGYGGSREEAGEAVGAAGDEGIDGVISEDRLGLDTIYLQAKRWEGKVGRPEIQKFVGALQGKRARKGVFITTGSFSADAQDYAQSIESKVVLIDGQQLAEFMIDFNVGVDSVISYDVKKIASDYFDEDYHLEL